MNASLATIPAARASEAGALARELGVTIPAADSRVRRRPLFAADPPPARGRETPRRQRRLGPGRPLPYAAALGPLLLLLAWFGASATGLLDTRVLSHPWTVATTLLELVSNGRLTSHLLTSAQRALLGLALGVSVGTVLALLSGLTRIGEALIDGPVQIKRAVPTLALIPLLILWFGIGEWMKVLTIAFGVFAPIYIQTHAGLRTIDARYVELAETVHLTGWQFIRKVALPGALPGFITGLRLAVTTAWLALVVVEQINATSGIGYMMSLARSYGQTEIIVVGLVVYGLFGLCSDQGVRWIERKALRWRRTLAG